MFHAACTRCLSFTNWKDSKAIYIPCAQAAAPFIHNFAEETFRQSNPVAEQVFRYRQSVYCYALDMHEWHL